MPTRKHFNVSLGLALIFIAQTVCWASTPSLKYSGEKMVNDSNRKTVLLMGKAEVTQGENKLVADKILVDQKNKTLVAEGNCTYQKNNLITKAKRIVFDTSQGDWIQK
jgi:lipopolysaccharide assembly outer membrane protein LptD (OstA)